MLLSFLRAFIKGWFFPNKRGYSLRGFWGQIKHFNKDGVQIGYSVKSFWGGRKRYDMNGKLISYTVRNFWGGYNTYDADGNLIRKSYRNFWGGYNTYNRAGKKIMESYQSFWGGMNHFDVEDSSSAETYRFEKYHTSTQKQRTYSASTTTKNVVSNNSTIRRTSENAVKRNPVPEKKVTESPKNVDDTSRNSNRTYESSRRQIQPTECVTNEVKKKVDFNDLFQQHVDKSIPFYEKVADFYEEQKSGIDGVKILVFSYDDLKEFPACAYQVGDEIKVCPLIKNAPAFEFKVSEILEANKKVAEELDMKVIDNEFVSLFAAKIVSEFDDLFPEYEYKTEGIARVQYELKCGLVITENSWLRMKEEFCK